MNKDTVRNFILNKFTLKIYLINRNLIKYSVDSIILKLLFGFQRLLLYNSCRLNISWQYSTTISHIQILYQLPPSSPQLPGIYPVYTYTIHHHHHYLSTTHYRHQTIVISIIDIMMVLLQQVALEISHFYFQEN